MTPHNANAFVRPSSDPNQPDLFAAAGARELRPSDKRIERLVPELLAVLRGRGWCSGADLVLWLGLKTDGLRTIREAANRSAGRVASGQQGYKLTAELTPDEFRKSAGRFRSQAKAMNQRYVEMQRCWHESGHTPVAW
jgi:hypothetical protein